MKDSELLQEVKKVIASDSEWHICTAIQRSVGSPSQKSHLTRWVQSMLGESQTLEAWLGKRGYSSAGLNTRYFEKCKQTRLAWLDWMIKRCKKDEV